MGFPAGSYTGLAFTSIFEIDIPGRLADGGGFGGVSFFVTAGFVGESMVVRAGGAWLYFWPSGAGLRSVIISISYENISKIT